MANGLSVSAGSLLVNGNVTLLGASSYSGRTTITAGTLQVDNGGSTATLGSGAIVNDGTALAFSRSDSALTVSQNISGTGQLWQIGTGVTTLSGSDSYTGGTNVTARHVGHLRRFAGAWDDQCRLRHNAATRHRFGPGQQHGRGDL